MTKTHRISDSNFTTGDTNCRSHRHNLLNISTKTKKSNNLPDTIISIATQLLWMLQRRIDRDASRRHINHALMQRPPTRLSQPTLSYAAVTIMGMTTNGVALSQPEPARRIILHMQEQNRQHLPNPIQGTTRLLIAHCLHTLLSPENRQDILSEALIDLVSLARKPTTFKKHAGYFTTWIAYAQLKRTRIFPISPFDFANYLMESAIGDKTASPTLSRCDAISFFCELSNTENPMESSLCRMIKEALKRRLGIRGKKKLPLLQEQLSAIFSRQLGNSHTLHTVVTCFRIALMYEGCLRWHDLAQINFGDIIITKDFIRIFVQSAKTDAYRQGQWVTIATSTKRFAAYSLLAQVLDAIAFLWTHANTNTRRILAGGITQTKESYLSLKEIPILFAIDTCSQLPDFSSQTQYPQFLNTLKDWGELEGIARDDIGTHSLRRGLASDWTMTGIPDRLRRAQGRWKSEIAADGYIDESINIQMQLRACHYAAKAQPQAHLSQQPQETSIVAEPHTPGRQPMKRTSRIIKKKVHFDE